MTIKINIKNKNAIWYCAITDVNCTVHMVYLISDRLPLGEINEVFKIRGKNGKMMIFPNE